MTSYLLAGPQVEPVSLDEAKRHLGVTGGKEDGLITALIAGARLHIEGVTNRALIKQFWRIVLDEWPDKPLRVPVIPMLSVTAITVYDKQNEPVDMDATAGEIVGGVTLHLPPLAGVEPRARGGIEIDYEAGYGADAADVPVDLRQALLTLIAYWFENRDAVITAGTGSVTPTGFASSIQHYHRATP